MKIDIERLLEDLGISTSTTGKHSRPGWINVECPFCTGNPGTHLGFNLAKGYANCWRCGHKHLDEVLMRLTGQNRAEIARLIKAYTGYGLEGDRKRDAHFAPLKLYYKQKKALIKAKSVTGRIFTRKEQAQNHCQVGNIKLTLDYILHWIP